MTERDELEDELEALGELQRERLAARVGVWDRLAAGELSADEAQRERLTAGDTPQQVELGLALFRPFDEDDDRALAEMLVTTSREPKADNVTPLRRRWPIAAALAAAAALLLIWAWSRAPREREPNLVAQIDTRPLPSYELTRTGGIDLVRGEPDEAPRQFRSDTPFEWVLEPKQDIETSAIALFAVPRDSGSGRELQLGSALRISPHGVIVIAGRGEQLGLERGAWRIVIAVARDRALLPSVHQIAVPGPSADPQPWRTFEFELEIVE
jgi:hypothetical protein